MVSNLHQLFYPTSVCLIGSSQLKEKGNLISPEIFQNISDNLETFFEGKVSIVDIEKTKQLPRADLYVLSLTEKQTLTNVENFDCKICIILPGNYRCKKLLIEKMGKKRIRFLGPNSVCGLINTDNGLNTTFERGLQPKRGTFSIIAQSGGVGASLLDLSTSSFTGIGKLIWLGDAWDIGFSDLISYLSSDRRTKSIGLYIEGIKKGKEFIRTVKKVRKPMIALKGGSSKAGAERALSHTSSLSGSSRIYSSVFKQTGIIEVKTMKELYEITHILSHQKKMKRNRIAIISNVGGPSILAADYALMHGLDLPTFGEKTVKKIKKEYPGLSVVNPLDLVADADAERYEFCLRQVLRDENIDAILVINMLKSCTLKPEETTVIAKVIKKSKKPMIDCAPSFDDWEKIKRVMNREGVYVFNDIERSVKTIRALYEYNMFEGRR